MLYAMFGELDPNGHYDQSDHHLNNFNITHESEVWVLNLTIDPKNRFWAKIVGNGGPMKYPSGLVQPAGGTSTFDRQRAYYAGGYESYGTTSDISDIATKIKIPGLIRFDFGTKQFTNSTDNEDCFQSLPPGPLFEVPFGRNGTLISFSGQSPSNLTAGEEAVGFGSVLICDKTTNKTYRQATTGDVPSPGLNPTNFASFFAFDEKNKTSEM
jgi:hypothetical protein